MSSSVRLGVALVIASIRIGAGVVIASVTSPVRSPVYAHRRSALRWVDGDSRSGALVGREEECAAMDRLLEAAAGGESSSLVLRGEPGIGKTALLSYAAERSRDERSFGSPVSRRSRTWASPVWKDSCGRSPESSMSCPKHRRMRSRRHSDWRRQAGRIGCWSPPRRSACLPRRPRTNRSCAWSTTCSSWTSPRWKRFSSARATRGRAGGNALRRPGGSGAGGRHAGTAAGRSRRPQRRRRRAPPRRQRSRRGRARARVAARASSREPSRSAGVAKRPERPAAAGSRGPSREDPLDVRITGGLRAARGAAAR